VVAFAHCFNIGEKNSTMVMLTMRDIVAAVIVLVIAAAVITVVVIVARPSSSSASTASSSSKSSSVQSAGVKATWNGKEELNHLISTMSKQSAGKPVPVKDISMILDQPVQSTSHENDCPVSPHCGKDKKPAQVHLEHTGKCQSLISSSSAECVVANTWQNTVNYTFIPNVNCTDTIQSQITVTSTNTGLFNVSGIVADIHLTNNGDCDAKIVSIVANLRVIGRGKKCPRCNDDGDEEGDDDKRRSVSSDNDDSQCRELKAGRIVGQAIAINQNLVGQCNPSTLSYCTPNRGRQDDCVTTIDVQPGETDSILDTMQSSQPIILGSYTVPRRSNCNKAHTHLSLLLDFELSPTDYASLIHSQGSLVVEFLVTTDTCCGGNGNGCSIDYDCNHQPNAVATRRFTSNCFKLPTCNPKCPHELLTSIHEFGGAITSHPFQGVDTSTLTLSDGDILTLTYGPNPGETHSFAQLCCDVTRAERNVPDTVAFNITNKLRQSISSDCQQSEGFGLISVDVHCPALVVNTDCVLSEWTPFSDCMCNATMDDQCESRDGHCAPICYNGIQSRTKVILTNSTGNGEPCPSPLPVETQGCRERVIIDLCDCSVDPSFERFRTVPVCENCNVPIFDTVGCSCHER
jgi:hypothetical protein